MDTWDRQQMASMQIECDDEEHRCAACAAGGLDADEVAIADEPVIVDRHYGGWASPLEGWRDLSDDYRARWLVPMCSQCAAMHRESEAS